VGRRVNGEGGEGGGGLGRQVWEHSPSPGKREHCAPFLAVGAKKEGNRRGTYSRKASLDSRLCANDLRPCGNITG
jgi:hypothetical protein